MVHRRKGLRRQPPAARAGSTSRASSTSWPCLRCPVCYPTGPCRADELAASAPKRGGNVSPAARGSKGHRLYDWLLVDPGVDEHLLLVRRSITKPHELAYHICHSSTPVPLVELVRVAGSRWAVEEASIRQKRHRPRPLSGPPLRRWYRHITLSCSPPRSSPSPPTPNKSTIKRGTAGSVEDLLRCPATKSGACGPP